MHKTAWSTEVYIKAHAYIVQQAQAFNILKCFKMCSFSVFYFSTLYFSSSLFMYSFMGIWLM